MSPGRNSGRAGRCGAAVWFFPPAKPNINQVGSHSLSASSQPAITSVGNVLPQKCQNSALYLVCESVILVLVTVYTSCCISNRPCAGYEVNVRLEEEINFIHKHLSNLTVLGWYVGSFSTISLLQMKDGD